MLLPASPEIGFLESFALAPDRSVPLRQLVPGTEDYYYFHALHRQHIGAREEFKALLEQWAIRFPHSARRRELETRQMLLDYDRDPEGTLAFIRERLQLHFDDQREAPAERPDLPEKLDPALVSEQVFLSHALTTGDALDALEVAAIERLIASGYRFTDAQRRDALESLERPDVPRLVNLIAEDLAAPGSRGFGQYPIHTALTLEQLEALRERHPGLMENQTFVSTWLSKLRPGADENTSADPAVRQAYLERAWAFVKPLGLPFTGLKAQVLAARLEHDRRQGVYDEARFLEYVKLPRVSAHINPEWRQREPGAWGHAAPVAGGLVEQLWPDQPWGEEEMVRSYLRHFLSTASSPEPYAPYFEAQWLRALFAEARLTAGVAGEHEASELTASLPPTVFEALKKRIDLDFDLSNPSQWRPDDRVSLTVWTKNTGEVTVKIFELNTAVCYEQDPRPIGTDIDLDGLVPALEKTLATDTDPLRRRQQRIDLPELASRRGVWVVELTGNGRSSRALLRKGGLFHVARASAAGTAIMVLDEARRPVAKASATLGGRRYAADEHGEIHLPFSAQPGPQNVILHDDQGFAVLEQVDLRGEQYEFTAGFHVEREALLTETTATLVVRPQLKLNERPVALSLLDKPRLTVISTDLDGLVTTVVVPNLKLEEHREFLHHLRVPARLASLHVLLEGEVKSLTQGNPIPLKAEEDFSVNGIDRLPQVSDLHLASGEDGWRLEERGKNGEPLAGQPLKLTLTHRDYHVDVTLAAKTDAAGCLTLGRLVGIDGLTVETASGFSRTWHLPQPKVWASETVHLKEGETLRVALPEASAECSLLETRGQEETRTFVKDWSGQLSNKSGVLEAQGLPAGDYELHVKPERRVITVRVTRGEAVGRFLVSPTRLLERTAVRALQVQPVEGQVQSFRVINAGPRTRVQAAFTRYVSTFSLGDLLNDELVPEPLVGEPTLLESQYVSGRELGEEFRYILERRQTRVFPGVMLPRPGLLLNPWAVRDTTMGRREAKEGTKYQRLRVASAKPMSAKREKVARRATDDRLRFLMKDRKVGADFGDMGEVMAKEANLDFLRVPAGQWFNLVPDAEGVVRLADEVWQAAAEAGATRLTLLAIDDEGAVLRTFHFSQQAPTATRDLRLTEALDPQQHFAPQDEVTVLPKGEPRVIPDPESVRFEVYDHLGRVFDLFRTLTRNDTLVEFSFVLEWPSFDEAKKAGLYSQYACHELAFFLAKKDPAFFQKVVRPYLANKHDKTFLDHYLLGEDLTGYLDSWRYSRLNTVERLLLARRIPEQLPAEARAVNDAVALLPVNREEDRRRLQIALLGQALTLEKGDAAPTAAGAVMDPSARVSEARMEMDAAPPGKSQLANQPLPAAAVPPPDEAAVEESESLEAAQAERDVALRRTQEVPAFYRKLDQPKEWAENNYWKLPQANQTADLVLPNRFWKDFAAWDGASPFLSIHVADATRNFSEMMLALAVLDLPFPSEAEAPEIQEGDSTLTVTPRHEALLFLHAARPAAMDETGPKLLVSQNFFRFDDRYEQKENGERVDKFVQGNYLAGVIYGAQVVVTNPTSSSQKLDLLFQIPQGALPVAGTPPTTTRSISLEPFHTRTLEVAFYFPKPGSFTHFPVHVARDGRVVAFAEPKPFQVTERVEQPDAASWASVSQHGTNAEVLAFLDRANVRALDLKKIAWRVAEKANFFQQLLGVLRERRVYEPALWRYAVKHNDARALGEFLRHEGSLLAEAGPWLHSSLVEIDPVERGLFEHLEYSPLVNARTHRLGAERTILNEEFRDQYEEFLDVVAHQPALEARYRLAATGYLLLQDRVEEALAMFEGVKREEVSSTLQYDYFAVWLALARGEVGTARRLAKARATEPIPRWREKFAALLAQLDEIEGRGPVVTNPESREQPQEVLAAAQPGFESVVENGTVRVTGRNLEEVTLNYYLMDLEFLFSASPFAWQESGRFARIVPNRSERVKLPGGASSHVEVPLARDFHNRNVLVEVTGAGQRQSHPVYASQLAVALQESYGLLQVRHATDQRPLSQVYVKVYALQNGRPFFYKDGYTDLRGKFDYASVSTNDLDRVTRFAILVLSPEHGALIREVGVPKR